MQIRKAKQEDAFGMAKVHVDSWLTTNRHIIPDEYLDQLTYNKREEKNPSKHFYDALGARKIYSVEIEVKGRKLREDVYGWDNIREILF